MLPFLLRLKDLDILQLIVDVPRQCAEEILEEIVNISESQ
jgi:hypothetical protein